LVVPPDTLTRSPAALTFATTAMQELSQAQTVTVTNGLVAMTLGTIQVSGTDPDDFVVLHDSCSGTQLDPGATCTFDVRFAPTATRARAATLTVQGTTVGNVYPTVTLSGTGGSLATGTTGPSVVRATLLRGDRILAIGKASQARITLHAARRIAPGRATLRFRVARRLRSVAVTVA
jgi:hypothetical protein